jgi:hypothetical protein
MKTLRNIFGNVWVLLGLAVFAVSLTTDLLPNLKQFISTWGI